MQYDKFGRTWKGRKIAWIRSSNCATLALYKWVIKDDKRVLVYDRKRGMYDKDGYHIQEMRIDILPVLEGKDERGNPVPGTWERFPDTKEAVAFQKSITKTNYVTHIEDSNSVNDFDSEYDEDIIIK